MDTTAKGTLINEMATKLATQLTVCKLCPRNCGVNRNKAETGFCSANDKVTVYTVFKHYGEEPAICGNGGSGTIFFSGCNLKCVYCQNHKFSHQLCGTIVDETTLSRIMLNLQKQGCHNINLVTPTHYLPQILKSAARAINSGLKLPLVYNTSGYEKKEIIQDLQGIVDIYLADFKYIEANTAQSYSQAPDYPQYAKESIAQMYKQNKIRWQKGLLTSGLIIRHLVLPGHIGEAKKILTWIKKETPQALVSIMFQYQPYFKTSQYPAINRKLRRDEYKEISTFVEEIGLKGWVQDFVAQESLAGVYFQPSVEEFIASINEREGDCHA